MKETEEQSEEENWECCTLKTKKRDYVRSECLKSLPTNEKLR